MDNIATRIKLDVLEYESRRNFEFSARYWLIDLYSGNYKDFYCLILLPSPSGTPSIIEGERSSYYLEFRAAVGGATFLGGVVGDGHALAVTLVLETVGRNAFSDQIVIDRLGTTLGKTVVIFVCALVVGVPANLDADGIGLQVVGQLVQLNKGLRLELGTVKVKEDILQGDDGSHIGGLQLDVLQIGESSV